MGFSESYDRRVTLTVTSVVFMLLLDGSILNTSLPAIAHGLEAEPIDLSAAVTVYLLAAAAVLPVSAWLGTRFGLGRVFIASAGLFTFASFACGCSQNLAQLIAARALQGAGGGLLLPVGRTLALQRARSEDIIAVTALLTWPALFAPLLGPPLGGIITTYTSWRWNFLLNVPLGAAAIVAYRRLKVQESTHESRPLDAPGAIGAAAGLMLMLGGLEWLAHADNGAQFRAAVCAGVGVSILAWTSRHLRRTSHPIVSMKPFAQQTFAAATAAGGTFAVMALQSTPFLLPLMFQLTLGRNALEAGSLLLPYFVGNLGMKSITTPLLVQFGFRRVMIVSGTCNAIAIAGFALVTAHTRVTTLVAWLVFAGCARSMLMTALNTLAFAELPVAQRAAASTLSAVSMQVAGALGVAIGTVILTFSMKLRVGQTLSLDDFMFAFIAMGAVCAATVIQFWRLPEGVGADVTGRA